MNDNNKASITKDTLYSLRSENLPMGRLSEVRYGNVSFQVQTELTLYPSPLLLTLIILGGEIKQKIENDVDINQERDDLAKLLNKQHIDSINELKEKISKKFNRAN